MNDEDIASDMLAHCVAGRTLQMARIVSARFDDALRPFGVTAHQLTLLSMVARRHAITPRDMLPFLKMDQSTLSRNLARLIDKGLLATGPAEDDGRTQIITLTETGRSTLRDAYSGWQEAQQWAASAFGQESMAELRQIAEKLNPLLPRSGGVPD